MKRSFLVAQLGARMHYAVPSILQQAGMLERLFTDLTAAKGWPRILGLLPQSILPASARRLAARMPRDIPAHKITAFTSFGWEYARRQARRNSTSDSSSAYLWAGKRFCQLILKHGFGNAQGIYTFNSAGLELLQEARRQGMKAIMEQTIAPKRIELKLLEQEHRAQPEWEDPPGENRFIGEYIEREESEWKAANAVLCGSEFVRDGIRQCGGPVEKCIVVPYGVNLSNQKPGVRSRKPDVGKRVLRVLTVGAVGLRKGSPYVWEAAKRLKGRVEFRMVGPINVSPKAQELLRQQVALVGPVPRSEIARHFEWADVFLLPSICEGSATVIYEAITYGLPVICTPNTGSVIRDGLDGFLVPASDVDAMVDRLEQIAGDTELRTRMMDSARRRSMEFTLASYGRRLIAALTRQPPSLDLSGFSIPNS